MEFARKLLAGRVMMAARHHARRLHLFWVVLLGLLLTLTLPAASAPAVLVLALQDAIGPASADYLVRGLRQASDSGAKLVVVELDTPGGLDTSMRQIIQAILASPVPVAVYVYPQGARAASAGTYILYAAHIAAMAPATTLGAATPVAIGLPGLRREPAPPAAAEGKASAVTPAAAPPDAMATKQVNDAAAFIRGLAQLRGRNAEWAERAVRDAATLTASEALRDKVIDVVAKDLPDLLDQIDGRTVRVQGADITLATRGLAFETRMPDWRQRLIALVANPGTALLLLMIGFYGLVFEFASPGVGVAGVAGAICLFLGLFALQLLPVNYAGLALILLGMGLLAAELVTPSVGVLGAGGVVAFVAGGLLLFDDEAPGYGVPLWLILALALSSATVIFLAGSMALKARRRPVLGGREGLQGATGEVMEVSEGEIWAQVQGERWRVTSRQPLASGQRIRVLGLHGLTLEVQAETEADTKAGTSKPQGASS